MPANPKLEWKFPVHSALSDKKWTEDSIGRMLRSVYSANPVLLNQPDEEGLRPVAIAAIQENFDAIKVMLEVAGPKLAEGEDVLGLQLCDNQNETAMSHNQDLLRQSPRFMIHEVLDNACKVLREGYIKNKLPKCTCGKCAAGWLSPRMRFRLREIAHEAHVTMLSRMDDFTEGQPLSAEAISDDPFLPFLPSTVVQQGIYKPFYLGYRAAFRVIRETLKIPDVAPTVSTLRAELMEGARSGTYNYSVVELFNERGGNMKHALDYVIHQALWKSPTPLGDGSFDQIWDTELPYPDPRLILPPSRVQRLSTPIIPRTPYGSPVPGSPVLKSAASVEPDGGSPKLHMRRRSNSFKDVFFGKKERAAWLIQIKEDDNLNHELQWKLKHEWEASGEPGCPLDTQFRGVRYLMGLHTPPRWEADEAVLAGVVSDRNVRCELKRMSGRF